MSTQKKQNTPPNNQPTLLEIYRDHLAESEQLLTIATTGGLRAALEDEIAATKDRIARLEAEQQS
jgi:hypothetical protein